MSTPAQRKQAARIAGLTAHSKHDSRDLTAKARATFLSNFEKQVDPEGILEPGERARRADLARRAHFARLALKRHHGKKASA